VQLNCLTKTARKTELNILWQSTGFPSVLSVFLVGVGGGVSSVCLLVRVTMVDKNKAVVYCLLATSAITLAEKKRVSGVRSGI